MTHAEFEKVIAFVEGSWNVELAAKQRDAYWLILRDSTAEAVMTEAVRLARSSRSRYGVPKPGELLGADDEAPALLAWVTLLGAIDRYGHYDSVEFEDRTLSACVEALGGWLVVSDWPTGNGREMQFRQRDFVTLYRVLEQRGAVGPMHHAGRFEQVNGDRFQQFNPGPVRITAPGKDPKRLSPPRLLPGPPTNGDSR